MKSPLHALPFMILAASLLLGACTNEKDSAEPEALAYLDTSLPLDTRVEDLVSRMTLSEKISQLYNEAPAIERLGVTQYNWWNEALHGVARAGKATVFPQAIGMAAAFNKPLLHEVATAISDEARAKHHYFVENDVVFRYTGLTFWSPNVNIFRDPRWGRGQETYGEDPYLTGTLAIEFITGLQGDNAKYLKTSAMAKHFAVHSGPEKSRHSDNYEATRKDMHETYLPAFRMAVVDADVESVMCAYNRVNGEPACGNAYLLKELLRGKWGFDGHVVSDCGALDDFYAETAHNVVSAPAEAAAWALQTGTDLDCGTGRLSTFTNLHFALQRGMVTEAQIDTAVKHLFRTRFKLGMFDPQDQVPYTDIPMSAVGSEEHLKLTREIAEQSLVLLKNNGLLPLKQGTKVAVIGPNATNPAILIGNYHGDPIRAITPLEGIKKQIGADNVLYAPGSSLISDIYGHYQPVPASVFFHRTESGELQPGLKAAYHEATLETTLGSQPAMATEPSMERIDDNIDFFWKRSPIDDSVWDEFGVVWEGVLVPEQSGEFRFDSLAKITIDGQAVEGPVVLQAGKAYAFNAEIVFSRVWWGNNALEPQIQVSWVNTSRDLAQEAIATAEEADVILFMGGISPLLEGEEMSVELEGFDHGDRTSLELPQKQQALLKRLEQLGKPIVLVNFSGSAMALNWADENLDAIVQAFYPGEATGVALARVLWGEVSPSGRLPVTFYRGVADLPEFKDYSMENRTYKYYEGKPLYPFGYGLSYSDFSYTNLEAPQSIAAGEGLDLQVTLKNEGPMDAAEVTQVYLTMLDAPVRVPKRALVAYTRTALANGEESQVELTVDPDQLRYVDDQGHHQVYSGRVKVTVGSGQPGYVGEDQITEATVTIQ